MTTLKIGIASYEKMKKRTMDIARGEYKPKRGEPKIWFTSIQSAARVLSGDNRVLLGLISTQRPNSIAELAEMSGRSANNLSRTLKTMTRLGLVTMEKKDKGRKAPRFPYDDILLDIPIPTSTSASVVQAAE
jgi:predicted transcriptional regulator